MAVFYQQAGIIEHAARGGQQIPIETGPVLVDSAALRAGNNPTNNHAEIGDTEGRDGQPVEEPATSGCLIRTSRNRGSRGTFRGRSFFLTACTRHGSRGPFS